MRRGERVGPPVLRGMRRASGRGLSGMRLREPAVRQVLRRLRRATWYGSRSAGCPGVAGELHAEAPGRAHPAPAAALEGERKQVTVLFADLKGSMELLADRDPEEARRILDPVLERDDGGRASLRGHGQPGDGRRHHGAVRRAARPRGPRRARLLRGPAHAGSGQASTPSGPGTNAASQVQIRVGLNSGEVVVRSIGSDLRMDYTPSGQTTHLAARMEQLAPPGTIRCAPTRCSLAEGLRAGQGARADAGEGASASRSRSTS